MIIIRCAVELDGDAQAVSDPAHTADQYRGDVEFPPICRTIDGLRFKAERGSPPDDLQSGNLLQRVDQLLSEAIAEGTRFMVVAEVGERNYGYGKIARWRQVRRRSRSEKIETGAREDENRERNGNKFPTPPRPPRRAELFAESRL